MDDLSEFYEEGIDCSEHNKVLNEKVNDFNLGVNVSSDYENLNDLNLLLGGLEPGITESLEKYKSQLQEEYSSKWAKEIINLYGINPSTIDGNTIRIALENTDLTPSQIEIAARHFEKTHNNLGVRSLDIIKNRFQRTLNALKMNWAINSFSNPEEIVERISKKGKIVIGDGLEELRDVIKEESIFDVNTEEIKGLSASGIKSSLDWINKQFATNGYPVGSLVLVCAAPGVGKSLFSMAESLEALKNGYEVVYTCIGDLGKSDLLIRLISLFYRVRMNHVVENIELYIERFKHDFSDELKRFHPLFIDPGTVTMSQLATYYKKKGWLRKNVVCVVDYDENLLPEKEDAKDGMMFEKFKRIYQIAISLTRGDDAFGLMFILGQPKTEAYNLPVLSLVHCSMGSTSKVHNVDICIGFSKEPCVNHQGNLSILKCRRHGRPNNTPYTLSFSGHMKPIDIQTYNVLKERNEVVTSNEEDINNQKLLEETKRMMLTDFTTQSELEL